ncbi:MAG: hypothetical protein ACK5A0_15030 [Polaromonas sp.]|jgi:hypothetical protein
MKPFNRKIQSVLALATLVALAAATQAQPGPAPLDLAARAKAAAEAAKNAADTAKARSEAAAANAQRALAAAKTVVVPPHPLLGRPFNPKVGPMLAASADQMTALLASVTTPAQAAPAMAKIMQMGANHVALEKEFALQIEHIAAAHVAGKKTAEMSSVETTVFPAIPAKGQALEDQVTRLSKLPLSATDMATLQNLRKALSLD